MTIQQTIQKHYQTKVINKVTILYTSCIKKIVQVPKKYRAVSEDGEKYRARRKSTRPPGMKNQKVQPITNLFANCAMNFSIHM